MAKREDILAAISALDMNDKTNWEANGVPNLDVIRKLTRDSKVTAADVAGAIASAPVEVQQRLSGVDPMAPHVNPVSDDVQRAELPDVEAERLKAAHETVAAVKPTIDGLMEQKRQLDKKIAEVQAKADAAIAEIDTLTPRYNDAEMIKRIQAQSLERARELAARARVIAGAAQFAPGAKVFPSQLDAALANGDPRRRSVAIVGGQPVQAASPRSPEGVKAYAAWVHSGR